MRMKMYAGPLKRRTTKQNASVWTDTLQMTKNKCIKRQKKPNCGIGMKMTTIADP
jgi:hypothetical protein